MSTRSSSERSFSLASSKKSSPRDSPRPASTPRSHHSASSHRSSRRSSHHSHLSSRHSSAHYSDDNEATEGKTEEAEEGEEQQPTTSTSEEKQHEEQRSGAATPQEKPVSPTTPTSPGGKSSKSANGSPKKSLDSIDLTGITEKDLAKRVKQSGLRPKGAARMFPSLPKAAFALFDSPRTLQALAEEGVDPSESLVTKKLKDFMRVSNGDATCAKIRYDHYENKRCEVLDTLKQRRQRIIDKQQQDADHYSTQRAVRTPVVQPTEELTGVVPPPKAETRQSASGSALVLRVASPTPAASGAVSEGEFSEEFSEDENMSGNEANQEEKEAAVVLEHEILSPDEFHRREAARKKAKVLRQAQKMREVMKANAKREQQKEESMAKILLQREEREAELAKKKRRQEIDRRVKESKSAKHEAELQILRDKREQAMQVKINELHAERGRKLQEFEDREAKRREKEEAEKEALNIKRAKKRHRVAIRALAIHEYSEKVALDQKTALLSRMAKADDVRDTLNTKKEKELAERKRLIEAQAAETRKKREEAEEEFISKINRYKEKAATSEALRQKSEKERADYFLFRSLQEKEKERERKNITTNVKKEEARRCQEQLNQLEAADLHCKELHEQKVSENRIKAARNAVTLDDRKEKVRRMQRMVQHSIDEAEQAYDAKIQRIENLMREAKEADAYRKEIQFKSARMQQSMIAANKKRALLNAAPGPLDYAAVEAELYLHGPGRGVNMGTPGHKSNRVDFSPGPGSYGIDAGRKIKGGVLPPKDVVGLADVQQILKDRQKKAAKEKREAEQQQRASSTLPPLGNPRQNSTNNDAHPRSESAPLTKGGKRERSVRILDDNNTAGSSNRSSARQQQTPPAKTSGAGSVEHPTELKEEDFCSSDEYDSASEGEAADY